MSIHGLRMHIRDKRQEIVDGWRPLDPAPCDFQFSVGDIFEAGPHCAIIAAGNSLGIMDGGLDLVYRTHFGMQVQDQLRTQIAVKWKGTLPVGAAESVLTGNREIPKMIYAPTMEQPMNVRHTWNAYLAFRAALWVIGIDPTIETVLCPGLCTLTGGMDPRIAAFQMMRAWRELRVHHGLLAL